jgi:ribonucleoside-diphosphate reductase alpha chain
MEQWLPDYDSCRLFALNLFTFVINPFTSEAYFDYDEFKRCAYFQQRLSDTLVDLEIEYVNRIISKIKNDPQPEEIKITELNLWNKVIKVAQEGRRSGNGFTALGDMLAALNMKYDSDIAIKTIEKVCSEKMHSELQCSIDLAILRGSFPLHDFKKEYFYDFNHEMLGRNEFYQFILNTYLDEINRMRTYGRRNLSWSTVNGGFTK